MCVDKASKYLTFYFRMWMYGPMGAIDPDQVDNDAGNLWRNLYKLEKTFGDDPNPQKMAQIVSQQHVYMHSILMTLQCATGERSCR